MNEGEIYEFQTAKICEPEKWNVYIKDTINKLNENCENKANPIPVMPKKVSLEIVKNEITDMSDLPIGISKKQLEVYNYDFTKRKVNVISSKNIEDAVNFVIHLIEEIGLLKNTDLYILDAEKYIKNKKEDLQKDYTNINIKMNLYNDKNIVCIIIGLDKFISGLDQAETEFQEFLHNLEEKTNISLIIVENATKIKNHEYDDWFREYITKENGIWVGNGIEDQYIFDLNSSRNLINNCGESFGYVINNSEETMIKLLGIKDKGDDDE